MDAEYLGGLIAGILAHIGSLRAVQGPTKPIKHTVQDVYKVASKNPAYTQFWCQHSSVRPKHFKNPHPLPAKDGLLVTGASQDHFVGFHHLTTLTGQGDIKVKVTIVPIPFYILEESMNPVKNFLSQMWQSDSRFLWYCRKCLFKAFASLKTLPQSRQVVSPVELIV